MANRISNKLKVSNFISGRLGKYLVAALTAVYVPVFALLLYVGTPRYVVAPYVYYWLAPASLGVFALFLFVNPRHVRFAAWSAVVVLGAWLLENYVLSIYYISQAKLAQNSVMPNALFGAVIQVSSNLGYWSFVLIPFLVALVFAILFRAEFKHAI
ncbi:MAG TPA: hypothetical protein VJS64_00445 [Pyrinomonadaceae bacterium]|nr:hypothetical protein [Pyrinomonadaceae bacterium]